MATQANKVGDNPLMGRVFQQVVGNSNNNSLGFSQEEMIETLLKKYELQGIKSVTYRWPVEEINDFDQMILDIQKALNGKRVAKNDVMRMAINLLIEDWRKRKKESLVFKVLEKKTS